MLEIVAHVIAAEGDHGEGSRRTTPTWPTMAAVVSEPWSRPCTPVFPVEGFDYSGAVSSAVRQQEGGDRKRSVVPGRSSEGTASPGR